MIPFSRRDFLATGLSLATTSGIRLVGARRWPPHVRPTSTSSSSTWPPGCRRGAGRGSTTSSRSRPGRIPPGLPARGVPPPARRLRPRSRACPSVRVDGHDRGRRLRDREAGLRELPGYFVPALLYRPRTGPGRDGPGILSPCGHSTNGKAAGAYQILHINLAKRGFVVLTYDPVGQGERSQFWDAAEAPVAVRPELRRARRAGQPALPARDQPGSLPHLGRHARARLPGLAAGGGPCATRLRGQLGRRHAHGLHRGARPAGEGRRDLLLHHHAPAPDGQPDPAGPFRRSRAGHLRLRQRRDRPRGTAGPARSPAHADRLGRRGLLPDRGRSGIVRRGEATLRGRRRGRSDRDGRGARPARAQRAAPDGRLRLVRPLARRKPEDAAPATEIAVRPRPDAELLVCPDGQVNLSMRSRPFLPMAWEEFERKPRRARVPLAELLRLDPGKRDPPVTEIVPALRAGPDHDRLRQRQRLPRLARGGRFLEPGRAPALRHRVDRPARRGHVPAVDVRRGSRTTPTRSAASRRTSRTTPSWSASRCSAMRVADVLAGIARPRGEGASPGGSSSAAGAMRRSWPASRRPSVRLIHGVACENMLLSFRMLFSAEGRAINAASILPGLLRAIRGYARNPRPDRAEEGPDRIGYRRTSRSPGPHVRIIPERFSAGAAAAHGVVRWLPLISRGRGLSRRSSGVGDNRPHDPGLARDARPRRRRRMARQVDGRPPAPIAPHRAGRAGSARPGMPMMTWASSRRPSTRRATRTRISR